MRKMILLLALGMAGCQPPRPVVPPIKPADPKTNTEQPKNETKPAPERKSPGVPKNDSFLHGYNDGFYGTWLGPIRWVVADDYRAGWNAGEADRAAKLPHRFGQ